MPQPFPFMHETRQRERERVRIIRRGCAAGRACVESLESADALGDSVTSKLARALYEAAAREASARAFELSARLAALS